MVERANVGMPIGLRGIAGGRGRAVCSRCQYVSAVAYAIGHSGEGIREWRISRSFMINTYKDYTYIYLYY